MDDSRFFLIALRVGQNCIHGRRVLKETQPYYFCQGYTISDDGRYISVDEKKCLVDSLFNDYLTEKADNNNNIPQVSIHAIVGKNGSGKSTVVEMMIRLLNDFATALFGEQITDHYRAHLHFIDGIDGELYYMLDDNAYRLRVSSIDNERKVSLERYNRVVNPKSGTGDLFEIIKDNNLGEIIINGLEPILEPLGEEYSISHYIDSFFYTIVSNYSIYAYNTFDYLDENVPEEYERKILHEKFGDKEKTMKVSASSCNWLHGLFHKNDGYKTPLVLTPFRDEGNIDINIENTLSRERFISLLLMSNDEGGKGFRIINGHLEVSHFSIKKKADYGRDYINKNVEIDKISEKLYNEFRIYFLKTWNDKLFGTFAKLDIENLARTKKYGKIALNYLIYKTFKICTKYRDYHNYKVEIENYLHGKTNDFEFFGTIDNYIDDLIVDRSHITRKIRQTLAYLVAPDDLDVYARKRIGVGKLAQSAKKIVEYMKSNYEYDFYIRDIEDVIPPPFLEAKILLKDLKRETKELIAFETLSSGEKQQVYSISSMLYHLMNINSVKEDKSKRRFSYKYVNIILEEIELYFHPNFQKNYISLILDGLAQVSLENICGVNICFVTHSPFVLSDIPRGNILALEDGKRKPQDNILTFGANIYDMLKSSFFIEGTPIGSYAQWSITRIIIALRLWRFINEYPDKKGKDLLNMVSSPKIDERNLVFLKRYFDGNQWEKGGDKMFEADYSTYILKRMISQIDEPFVRNSLMREYYEVFNDDYNKQIEINELERRLLELKDK